MTAHDRFAQLNGSDATQLCARAEQTLIELVEILSRETMLLRAGNMSEAAKLATRKAQLAQDYVGLARAVQNQAERIRQTAPNALARVRARHESLATQMADNLRVLATARQVTEDLLSDVATTLGKKRGPAVYGATGAMAAPPDQAMRGLSVNRAL